MAKVTQRPICHLCTPAAILDEGRVHARQVGEHEKVETYWHVGDAIYVHLQDRTDRAAYGQGLVANLSKDLHLSESTLHDIVRFRRSFANLSTSRELTWSHYRALIRLPGVDQRRPPAPPASSPPGTRRRRQIC